MTPISGTLPATLGSDRERLSAAAKQFEAIFIRQMLSAARQSSLGGDLLGGKGVDTFREMQDARFADLAAESGTFGLAKHIEAQLSASVAPGASTSSARAEVGLKFTPHPARPEPVEGRQLTSRQGEV